MKRNALKFYAIIIVVFAHYQVQAQKLSLGVGVSTLSHEDMFPDKKYSLNNVIAVPNYWANAKLGFGNLYGVATVQFTRKEFQELSLLTPTDTLVSHLSRVRNSAMLGLGYYWFNVPMIKVFSDINLGYQMVIDSDLDIYKSYIAHKLAYQVTFIGFRIGGKLAFTTEVGYGRKGLFSVGICYGNP